ncbi:MAG TPA: hemerythrin domain-containing protein [Acidimicrobiales bacterium]|nr:hemerythrin domain-containing protein [Acidimicrobiales bacterium]
MSEQAGAPRPDVTDMYAVHGVFRDTLGSAPQLVGGVRAGDVERVALIVNYYENILSFLEAHHDAEEKLVFPLLRERCPGEDALVDRMAEQHHEAVRLLEEAQRLLQAWPAGDAAAQKAALDGLEALHAQLVDHLDQEEAKVLPLAAENLSAEEWGALPGHGMANFHGDKIWLILGLIRERMTDAQRAAMLEHMPPPALDMWTGFGEQAFKDYSAIVEVPVSAR